MAIGSNIKIINSFSMATSKPLDDREVVSTIEEMLAIPDYLKWIGMQVYVTDNNTRFKWDGTTWFVEHLGFCKGEDAPGEDQYSAGDMYIDTSTGDLYYKILNTSNALAWELQTNIIGPQGIQGEQGIRGIHGSYWYTGTSMTGTSADPTVFPDSGIDQAEVNDCYINVDNGQMYQCVTAGNSGTAEWIYTGTLKGTPGIQGPQGERGEQGDIGPEGPQGIRGSNLFSGTELLGPTPSTGQVFPDAVALADIDIVPNDTYINSYYGHMYSSLSSGKGNEVLWNRIGIMKPPVIYLNNQINSTESGVFAYPLSGIEYANVGDWSIHPGKGWLYTCVTEGDPNTATWQSMGSFTSAMSVSDTYGHEIGKYVYGIANVENKTLRITLGDGSYTDLNIQINPYQGATESASGVAGLVPVAAAGDQAKYLRADGTWATVDQVSCDSALSTTSTNPVQNAVITAKLNELQTQITNLTNTVNGKLASNAKITLSGDVSGTGTFANNAVTITTTVADDSHNHTIANIDNLQSQLNTISSNATSAKSVTDKYATMLNIIGNNQ